MEILKLIGIIGLICLGLIAWGLVVYFQDHCYEKFDHRFLDRPSFIFFSLAIALLLWGGDFLTHPPKDADLINGIVRIVIGGLILAGLITYNCKKTSRLCGFAGTVLQFLCFPVLLVIGPFWLTLRLIRGILFAATVRPVYIINK